MEFKPYVLERLEREKFCFVSSVYHPDGNDSKTSQLTVRDGDMATRWLAVLASNLLIAFLHLMYWFLIHAPCISLRTYPHIKITTDQIFNETLVTRLLADHKLAKFLTSRHAGTSEKLLMPEFSMICDKGLQSRLLHRPKSHPIRLWRKQDNSIKVSSGWH